MAENIELKVPVQTVEAFQSRIARLEISPCEVIEQEDTFFRVPEGRLKMREVKHRQAWLIEEGEYEGAVKPLTSVSGIHGPPPFPAREFAYDRTETLNHNRGCM